jgi:hypothetical protein
MPFNALDYSKIKARLKRRYQLRLKNIRRDLRGCSQSKVAQWVTLHGSELKPFSSVHWLFLTQLELYLFFNQQNDELGKDSFGELEEKVFEKWNQSEFAREFLKLLNEGDHIGPASRKTLRHLDRHLETFAERHILKNNHTSVSYRIQTSLGEVTKGKKIHRLLESILHIEGKDLKLFTHSVKEMNLFSQRIEFALKVIRTYSPSSWDRFIAFTEAIIPIKQVEFVSYSHQDLPGHSMINLYHRDFVDLMDDLLHENGHHHLNYYLNLSKLIEDPVENIYYSPWRRTLRPLRGVFHAYFTFFWAFKLFADLSRAENPDSIFYVFNQKEKEKIIWRAVEEFHMLNFTYKELQWAKKNKLIHAAGWELISEQQKELKKFSRLIPSWEKKLAYHKKELITLKKTLKSAQRDFLKN